ncbi:MAG: sigma-E factor negative regulatory protein [Thiogranum sp.]
MSDEIREQLSALADDELSDVERPLLLGRMQRDAGLRECLGRYQLIGEVMRGIADTTTLGVADRVRRVLQEDVSGQLPDAPQRENFNWWKPLAGVAVAASVALVAVLAVSSLRETATGSVPELASAQTVAPAMARVSDGQWDRIEAGIDKRLSGYLVNHNEYAASRGVQGVMPYVRIVGFENDER